VADVADTVVLVRDPPADDTALAVADSVDQGCGADLIVAAAAEAALGCLL